MDKKIVFYALIGIDIVIVALLCFLYSAEIRMRRRKVLNRSL